MFDRHGSKAFRRLDSKGHVIAHGKQIRKQSGETNQITQLRIGLQAHNDLKILVIFF